MKIMVFLFLLAFLFFVSVQCTAALSVPEAYSQVEDLDTLDDKWAWIENMNEDTVIEWFEMHVLHFESTMKTGKPSVGHYAMVSCYYGSLNSHDVYEA